MEKQQEEVKALREDNERLRSRVEQLEASVRLIVEVVSSIGHETQYNTKQVHNEKKHPHEPAQESRL